jgi:nucleoside phosphorylase
MSMVDVLVIGAHPPALIGLRDHLGQALHGSAFGLNVSAKVCGVGMGVAGAWTAKRLVQLAPRAVVLVGTTGIYPGVPGFQPLDVVVAEELKLLDHAALGGHAAYPTPMQTQLSAPSAMTAGLLGDQRGRIHRVKIASPLADTRDTGFATAVPARLGCAAESLEAFAVAQACQLMDVPFGVALGISHVLGEHAETDWQRYQRDASRASATAVLNWIHAGAPGMPHRTSA